MSDDESRPEWLLVVPVFQSVYPQAFGNFLAMALSAATREHEKYRLTPHVPRREILHAAMNRAAALVVEHGFAGLIMADDDCFPPFDAISRLLRRHEEGHQIVSGLGYMRGYPFTVTVGRYFPEGISIAPDKMTGALRLAGFEWIDDVTNEPELIDADFCGFPITLVSADALRKMERPWFGTSIDGGECTHDVYFGYRAKAAGLSIKVDRTIDCGHMIDAPIISAGNRDLARQLGKS